MKLIDSELVELAKKYGNQDNARDPVVIARYMSTTSPAVWLVIDFDPETGEAVAYKAGIGDDGWDLFNLLELSQLRIPTTTTYYDQASKRQTVRKSFGRVIRDNVFTPRRLSEVMPEVKAESATPIIFVTWQTCSDATKMRRKHKRKRKAHDAVSNRLAHQLADSRFLSATLFYYSVYRDQVTRFLACPMWYRFINWLVNMLKPKSCIECGQNNFCITEKIKYNGHIDAKTKKIITDSVMVSDIEDVYCIMCGTVQDRADFGMSELT